MKRESEKHHLYRHFDAQENLLYVGISLDALQRLRAHRTASRWFDDISLVKMETFPSRAKALSAERAAIINEKPKHNVVHNSEVGQRHLFPELEQDHLDDDPVQQPAYEPEPNFPPTCELRECEQITSDIWQGIDVDGTTVHVRGKLGIGWGWIIIKGRKPLRFSATSHKRCGWGCYMRVIKKGDQATKPNAAAIPLSILWAPLCLPYHDGQGHQG
jgi:predicted GIY-YIG superfamily endonuclease